MKLELILALAAGFGAAPYLDNHGDIAPMSPAPAARLTPQSEPVPSAEAYFEAPPPHEAPALPEPPAITLTHMDVLKAAAHRAAAPVRLARAEAPRPRLRRVPWIAERNF